MGVITSMRRAVRVGACAVLWPLAPAAGAAPCAALPAASAPRLGQAPAIEVWVPAALAAYSLPRCGADGADLRNTVLAVGAFRFADAGGVDGLLARFSAVSGYKGIRYHAGRDAPKPLFREVYAVQASGVPSVRPDFSVAELLSGVPLYLVTIGEGTDPIVQRLRVKGAAPDRLAMTMENVSAIRWHGLVAVKPGGARVSWVFERESPEVWRLNLEVRLDSRFAALLDAPELAAKAAGLLKHFSATPVIAAIE